MPLYSLQNYLPLKDKTLEGQCYNSSTQLKNTDQSILDDIQRLIEIESDEDIFVTSVFQKNAIELARSDVRNGKTIDGQEANQGIDPCLIE